MKPHQQTASKEVIYRFFGRAEYTQPGGRVWGAKSQETAPNACQRVSEPQWKMFDLKQDRG